jgi:hypothetical protein
VEANDKGQRRATVVSRETHEHEQRPKSISETITALHNPTSKASDQQKSTRRGGRAVIMMCCHDSGRSSVLTAMTAAVTHSSPSPWICTRESCFLGIPPALLLTCMETKISRNKRPVMCCRGHVDADTLPSRNPRPLGNKKRETDQNAALEEHGGKEGDGGRGL